MHPYPANGYTLPTAHPAPEVEREMLVLKKTLGRVASANAFPDLGATSLPANPPNVLFIIGESWNARIVGELNEELRPFLAYGFVSPLYYS